MEKQIRCIVRGRVQGVLYRASAKALAERLGVKGFVENLPDGTVLVEASVPEEKLEQFKAGLEKGSFWSKVEAVDCANLEGHADFDGFKIKSKSFWDRI